VSKPPKGLKREGKTMTKAKKREIGELIGYKAEA